MSRVVLLACLSSAASWVLPRLPERKDLLSIHQQAAVRGVEPSLERLGEQLPRSC